MYDFDYTNQTALHWAAKRNEVEMVEFLIKKKSRVDPRDSAGRTPLLLATKKRHLAVVKALLRAKARPSLSSTTGESALKTCSDELIQWYLDKAELLHLILPMAAKKRRNRIWKAEGLKYFSAPDTYTVQDLNVF